MQRGKCAKPNGNLRIKIEERAQSRRLAPLRLVSDRTASWEWESGERRRGLSPRYRLARLAPRG